MNNFYNKKNYWCTEAKKLKFTQLMGLFKKPFNQLISFKEFFFLVKEPLNESKINSE